MSRLNKVIIFFCLFTTFIIWGAWSFLESENAGKIINEKVSPLLSKRYGLQVNFKKVEINLFPPSTIIRDLKVLISKDAKKEVLLEEVKLKVNFLDLLSSKLTISEVTLSNGHVSISLPSDKKPQIKKEEPFKLNDIFNAYRKIKDDPSFKIKKCKLTKIAIQVGDNNFFLEKGSLSLFSDQLRVSSQISKIDVPSLPKQINLKEFDYVKTKMNISKDFFEIEELILAKNKNILTFSGVIKEKNKIKGVLNYKGEIEEIIKKIDSSDEDVKNIKGYTSLSFDIDGDIENPDFDFDAVFNDLSSEWILLDRLVIKGSKKRNIISIKNAKALLGKGTIHLNQMFDIFDLDKKSFIKNFLNLKFENVFTNDGIYVAREEIQTLKGYLSGNVIFSWKEKDLFFKILEGAQLKKFKLLTKKKTKEIILQNRLLLFKESLVSVGILGKKEVALDLDFGTNEFKSHIKAKGVIRPNLIDIKAEKAKIDFKDIGKILNLQALGEGFLDLRFAGTTDEVVLSLFLDMNDFSLLGFNLGKTNGSLELNLDKDFLKIENLDGLYGSTSYTGKGVIDFSKGGELKLSFDFKNATFKDSREIYKDLILNLDLPKGHPELEMTYDASYNVDGNIKNDKIHVVGNINGKNMRLYGEKSGQFFVDFDYTKEKLNIKRFHINKGAGVISGKGHFDMNSDYVEYDADLASINLSDFDHYRILDFGLDGSLAGSFYGSGTLDDFSSKAQLKLSKSYIGNRRVEDSSFNFYSNKGNLFASGELFGNRSNIDLYFDTDNKNKKKNSYIKGFTKLDELSLYLGVLSGHNINDQYLNGKLKMNGEAYFNFYDFWSLDAKFFIGDFFLGQKEFSLALSGQRPNIVNVKNGEIKKWDIVLRSGKHFIKSLAEGKLGDNFKAVNTFYLPVSILKLVTEDIEATSGSFLGEATFDINKEGHKVTLLSNGEKIDLKIKNIAGYFSNVNYSLRLEDNKLMLEHFRSDFGKGKLTASGGAFFSFGAPKLDFQFKIDNALVPILEKSSALIVGRGSLEGNETPYLLSGQFSVLRGSFLDDFDKIGGDNNQKKEIYNRFIPDHYVQGGLDWLLLDISVNLLRPMAVKNGLANFELLGDLTATGQFLNPIFNGKLYTLANKSSLNFKGHEFILDRGEIIFDKVNNDNSPDLNLSGVSIISDYKVKLKVGGSVDDTAVSFSSEPPLSREDILSLLTLGITRELSESLEDDELQSITTLGIGSILVDQLKINDELYTSMGLKLSVAPEFSQDETSFLQGRSGTSGNGSTRVRSSTKIKVQKKISSDVDLSLSSTVGGTLEQTQEMNINYNLDKNWSILGVWEKTSSTDDIEVSPDSIGADLKYKWSF